jgi:2-C-methyl-D-erythritol 4-phosphate cytidylyltransferase/2-C-methyl-D-erythritol 2,4-cyclodiphosphate synthase
MSATYAVIVAAGRGTRFGGALPKQYLGLGGSFVLRHAVAAFAAHPRIAGTQVVIRDEDRAMYEEAVAGLRVRKPRSLPCRSATR